MHRSRLTFVCFSSTACISGCDFDTTGDLCGWTTEAENPAIFGFEQWGGSTETEGSGPEDDFSKPGCKLFFSMLTLTLKVYLRQTFLSSFAFIVSE